MQLEEYWGVGPKTRETLESELGVERAITAIEAGDVRALSDAGLPRGRATRILRRATGGPGMEMLATSDALAAYKDLLDLIVEHAVTDRAADRIRILTPLTEREAITERLDAVLETRDAWAALDENERETVRSAFERYDAGGGSELAAVEAVLSLHDAALDTGPFGKIAELDDEALHSAATALSGLENDGNRVGSGVDDELDRVRNTLGALEDMGANTQSVIEDLRADGAQGVSAFRETFEDRLLEETAVQTEQIRAAMPTNATDALGFVEETLRELRSTLRTSIDERESQVAEDLQTSLTEARSWIDEAVSTIDDVALYLSLAQFSMAYDCTRPTFVDSQNGAVSVVDARNLTVAAREEDTVQPITYGLGEHSVDSVPADDRVAVLTGANSGGKTTLLETLCQVVLLASMGLPVPAERAEVSLVDDLVFHRRHASFNAGVLESTLRSIVPPLSGSGRTLMLVDEFEAITEPGRAADLLHGLVTLTVDRDALGIFVTHLADDLEPLPPEARVDGIFAEGLNADLELVVEYQPRFETVGRSTPEFIVSRLLADSTDRTERTGFETLAESIGADIVQRTLADARWTE